MGVPRLMARPRMGPRLVLASLAVTVALGVAVPLAASTSQTMNGGGCGAPSRAAAHLAGQTTYAYTSACIQGMWGTGPDGTTGSWIRPDARLTWRTSGGYHITACVLTVTLRDDTRATTVSSRDYDCTVDLQLSRGVVDYPLPWISCASAIWPDQSAESYHSAVTWTAWGGAVPLTSATVNGPSQVCT